MKHEERESIICPECGERKLWLSASIPSGGPIPYPYEIRTCHGCRNKFKIVFMGKVNDVA